jgi:hypothetical protein
MNTDKRDQMTVIAEGFATDDLLVIDRKSGTMFDCECDSGSPTLGSPSPVGTECNSTNNASDKSNATSNTTTSP